MTSVLYITSEIYPFKKGGPQNVLYNLANRLSDSVDIHLLCILPKNPNFLHNYYKNVKFHPIKERKLPFLKYLYYNIAYFSKIKKLLNSFDIIHFQILPGAKVGVIPYLLSRMNIKYPAKILTIYDWIPMELTFYDSFLDRIRHNIHWSVSKYNLAFFDKFVVNSTFMKNILENVGLKNIKVIPNGINFKEWQSKEKIKLEGSINLFFWGKLYSKKGVEYLLKAFSFIHNEYDVKLYIGGSGPKEKKYKKMAKTIGIEKDVIWLGFLDKYYLRKYLISSDICILPSLYEGFGIAILEAMAAGKAIITSNFGGQTDFAKNEYNSILVNTKNPLEISEAIINLIKFSHKRGELAKRAKQTAKNYDWNRISKQYVKFYKGVLEK